MTTVLSKDIQSLVSADKINDHYHIKHKLLWGPDGTANDVTTTTPFPVGIYGPFVPPSQADSISFSYPDALTEVYQYRSGGISGTVLMTLTLTFVDATKIRIASIVRTP